MPSDWFRRDESKFDWPKAQSCKHHFENKSKICVRLIVDSSTGAFYFDMPYNSPMPRRGFGMTVTKKGLMLVGGQVGKNTLGGMGIVEPPRGIITRKRRQTGIMGSSAQFSFENRPDYDDFMSGLVSYDLQKQQEQLAEIERKNELAQAVGDLELIYKVGNEYVSEFGSDLPDKFNRARAFDRVVARGDYVYMVLNSEAKETKLIS